MKYTAFWLTLAAACAFSAGSALAQGAGQGHHEVGSGSGNPSVEAPSNGGIGGNNTSGQGHYGPNGSGGAAISGGPNSNAAGQGQFEAGGSGGGPVENAGPSNNGVQAPQQINRGPNDWRFVYSNGMWWYYQPDNSWTYYQNGSWQNYDEPRTARMDRDHANMQDHANAARDNNAANRDNAKPENSNSNNNNRVEKH
jgi:hypothetical protein